MRITFLGSSHGVPAPDRYCSCAMVEVKDTIYLIDAGAPVIDELLRLNRDVHQLRAVFTTHVHTDHTHGVLQLASLMNWYYRNASADFYFTETKLCDALTNVIETMDGQQLDAERVRFHCVAPDFCYEDENIRVTLCPTQHMPDGRPSYGILLESEGKRVLFSGDMSYKLQKKDVPEIVTTEELDVFVCELAHFGIEELTPYLQKCKAKQVYMTHVNRLEKFEDIKAIDGKYSFPVHIVHDRDVIEL